MVNRVSSHLQLLERVCVPYRKYTHKVSYSLERLRDSYLRAPGNRTFLMIQTLTKYSSIRKNRLKTTNMKEFRYYFKLEFRALSHRYFEHPPFLKSSLVVCSYLIKSYLGLFLEWENWGSQRASFSKACQKYTSNALCIISKVKLTVLHLEVLAIFGLVFELH